METSSVHRLNNFAMAGSLEPDQSIIDTLEEMLAAAKSGDIQALAAAYLTGTVENRMTNTFYQPGNASFSHLIGATAQLQHRMSVAWDRE